jgi:hypothetical protein
LEQGGGPDAGAPPGHVPCDPLKDQFLFHDPSVKRPPGAGPSETLPDLL